ncbi:MAG: hypothetical protein K8S99_05160 [Planctomycetes bacterium]|nr:hypothetical protein [Planctomycetota bacterium]
MQRDVVITGLGPITALGVGIDATWSALLAGRSAIAPIAAFDPAGFTSRIGAEVRDLKVSSYVPKSYRKAVKVMARDIEIAVAAADQAARDAGLVTKGTAAEGSTVATSYPPARVGAHIGAGLIAAELDELTFALASSRAESGAEATGGLDMHKWGSEGITQLTPLWLLKYLPNMLACHVTIIHDAQGPSNTITCGEASSGLSIGESFRVIQRGSADACFCGGAESKFNPMAFLRQIITGRLNTIANPPDGDPASAVRPFSRSAAGSVIGEGGGIVVLESLEGFKRRGGARAYARVLGFGASQTIHPESRSLRPDPAGRGIALAIKAALRDAKLTPDAIDLIIPIGAGFAENDAAEANAMRTVFGDALAKIPLVSTKPYLGSCGAGAGGIDTAVAAKALAEQTIPPVINCDDPLPGLNAATAPARQAALRHVLTFSTSIGGQNAAMVLGRA